MTRASELMARYVEFIDKDATVKDAAAMMGELAVGALPVGTPESIEGILTDRDILYRVVAEGLDSSSVRVGDVMSHPVIACAEEDTVRAVMDIMSANHIRRLPVRDGRGHVSGWITLADLSRKLLVESDLVQTSLRAATDEAD